MCEDLIYSFGIMADPPAAVLIRNLVLALRLRMELALDIEEVHEGEADEEVGRPV